MSRAAAASRFVKDAAAVSGDARSAVRPTADIRGTICSSCFPVLRLMLRRRIAGANANGKIPRSTNPLLATGGHWPGAMRCGKAWATTHCWRHYLRRRGLEELFKFPAGFGTQDVTVDGEAQWFSGFPRGLRRRPQRVSNSRRKCSRDANGCELIKPVGNWA